MTIAIFDSMRPESVRRSPLSCAIPYPDAGHAAHYQYPELFLKHSKSFLDS
jgi:hypothetical protein